VRADPDSRPLAAVAAAVTVLGAAGVVPVWAGLAHHLALPPLDLFADVRVLLSESPSYPAFLLGLVAVLGLRVVVLAAVLRSLDRSGLARAARFYTLSLPAALVAGGLAFSGVAAVYSPFLWLGVAVAAVTVLVAGPRPWRPVDGRRAAAKALTYFATLLLVALPSALGGTATRLVLVWASAALTVTTAHWMGRGRTGARSAQIAPASSAPVVGVVAVLVAGAVLPVTATRAEPVRGGTLFVVPGIGGSSGTATMFSLDPARLGYECSATVYFSYAGPGTGAPRRDARCPIRSGAPYGPEDTRRPLDVLVRSFRDQYASLDPPVVVVAHSQGGWIAAAALAGDANVRQPTALVLLGAFPGHRTAYDVGGGRAGVVGTDGLEVLTAALRGLRGTTFDPRAPLARELLGTTGAIIDVTRGALAADVRVITVTSAFDLPIMAGDDDLDGAVELCPVYVRHGDLPRSPRVLADVRRVLESPAGHRCAWWRRWPAQAFSAFAVPAD
jgi:hypothetical protein